MTPKKNKILTISICVVAVAAISTWYFLPFIAGKWFISKNTEFLHQLSVRPSKIEKLPASLSDEWENIPMDTLSLSLPMHRFNKIKISSNSTGIGFLSDKGNIFLPSIVPPIELMETLNEIGSKYPLMPYKDRLAIYATIPDDVSFFKSRTQNKITFINLTLKLMAIPVFGINDLLTVNSSNLKAICIMHEKRQNGFGAIVILYNQKENMTFDMTFMGYENSELLKSDILNILGSMKMSDEPLNTERVKTDIESISRKYKLTEQTS